MSMRSSQSRSLLERAKQQHQQLESKQRTSPSLVSDTFESLTVTAWRVGPSSRCCATECGAVWTLGGVQTPRARTLHAKTTFLRQQLVLPPGSLGKKEHRSECTTTSVRISDAGHVTNGTPDRPSTMIAPIGCGEHEEELVGLKERIEEEPRHKLRDTELEIQEADVPRVPATVTTPSPEEHHRHCPTHLPYRNWCPICVQAKKRKIHDTSTM